MSVEQLETTIEAMSAGERMKFVRWFDAHRHELFPAVEAAQQRELLTRLAETAADPSALEPFAEADLDRMIGEAVHAHTQKASARRG